MGRIGGEVTGRRWGKNGKGFVSDVKEFAFSPEGVFSIFF